MQENTPMTVNPSSTTEAYSANEESGKQTSAKLNARITKEDLRSQLEDMAHRVMKPVEGIYGPQSMAWKVNRHTTIMMGAGAANLLQLAHPWVTHAIDQHSKTQTEPFARLRRTFLNVHSMIFGNLDQVLDSALRVHNIHAAIVGKVRESAGRTNAGSDYFANQVGAMMWVYATLWVTGLRVHELFNAPLTKAEREQYYQESKLFAFLFGIPESVLPDSWDGFIEYFDGVVNSDLLAVGDVGRQLVEYIFSMKAWLIPVLNRHKLHTTVLLPERLRREFGFPELTPRVQASFDFDVKLIGTVMHFAPDNIKYMPPYNEALQRLKGEKAGMVTRGVNKLIYGQPLLVS